MKTPVAIVTAALTAAILLTVSLLIATSTRGEDAGGRPRPIAPADRIVQGSPSPT